MRMRSFVGSINVPPRQTSWDKVRCALMCRSVALGKCRRMSFSWMRLPVTNMSLGSGVSSHNGAMSWVGMGCLHVVDMVGASMASLKNCIDAGGSIVRGEPALVRETELVDSSMWACRAFERYRRSRWSGLR